MNERNKINTKLYNKKIIESFIVANYYLFILNCDTRIAQKHFQLGERSYVT